MYFARVLILTTLFFLVNCNDQSFKEAFPPSSKVLDQSIATSLTLTPNSTTIALNQTATFTVSGGKSPYTFSKISGNGSISTAGVYTAPNAITVTVIRVTDSDGAYREATINVYETLAIFPSSRKLNVSSTLQFSASGGTSPYTYSLVSGLGSVTTAGLYTATASTTTAVVRVTDALGVTSDGTITVGNGPIISPTTTYVQLGQNKTFTATSGTAPYTWSITSGSGSVSVGGIYTATNTHNASSTVRVTDVNGFYSEATVTDFRKHILTGDVYHTCIINGKDKKLYCLGSHHYEANGKAIVTGRTSSSMGSALIDAKLPSDFVPDIVSVGLYHTCVSSTSGNARCWGWNSNYTTGVSTQVSSFLSGDMSRLIDVNLGTSFVISDLFVSSSYQACALSTSGTFKCWGNNDYGQLGRDSTSALYNTAIDVFLPVATTAKGYSSGYYNTCVHLANDTVKCCGYNAYGQLGQDNTNTLCDSGGEAAALSPIALSTTIKKLFKSQGYHNCAILDNLNNDLVCWGYNAQGQLGRGDTTTIGSAGGGNSISNATAVNLGSGLYATDGCAGLHYTCAVLNNGKLKCFGQPIYGQLGQGNSVYYGSTGATVGDNMPYVNLGAGRTVSKLSCGNTHVCAELDNGHLKCWGDNTYGQTGLGVSTDYLGDSAGETPDLLGDVNIGSDVNSIISLSAGAYDTCLVVELTDTSKKLRCFGRNVYGEHGNEIHAVGDNSNDLGSNWTPVSLGTSMDGDLTSTSIGYLTTIAMNSSAQVKIFGWGYGSTDPSKMGDSLAFYSNTTGKTIQKLVGSTQTTQLCSLFTDGTLRCIGYNAHGQGGQNTTSDLGSNLAAVADINLGATVTDVAVNYYHTCALLTGGSVKCWGYNGYGQLGQGDNSNRGDDPGEMAALSAINLGTGLTAQNICVGAYFSCAILSNNKVKCWGYNGNGELGNAGTTTYGDNGGEMGDSLPYVSLGTGRTATKISCGTNHACAILDNQKVKCWGYNQNAQLGLGHNSSMGHSMATSGDSLPYVNMGSNAKAIDILAYYQNTCAILEDNQVKCWGYNAFGKCGQGKTSTYIGDSTEEMGDNLRSVDLP